MHTFFDFTVSKVLEYATSLSAAFVRYVIKQLIQEKLYSI